MRFQEKDIRKIKLIIWDLDDTFWKGTLSDNGNDATVVPITENIQLVKTLTRRGIINSICSKNDAQTAKAELKRQGGGIFFRLHLYRLDTKRSTHQTYDLRHGIA